MRNKVQLVLNIAQKVRTRNILFSIIIMISYFFKAHFVIVLARAHKHVNLPWLSADNLRERRKLAPSDFKSLLHAYGLFWWDSRNCACPAPATNPALPLLRNSHLILNSLKKKKKNANRSCTKKYVDPLNTPSKPPQFWMCRWKHKYFENDIK